MALNITKVQEDGVSIPFWVAKLQTFHINVNPYLNDTMEILAGIKLYGYLSSAHYTAGTYEPAGKIDITDLTQNEAGDILKKIGKNNLKKETYKIIMKRLEWSTATESDEDET